MTTLEILINQYCVVDSFKFDQKSTDIVTAIKTSTFDLSVNIGNMKKGTNAVLKDIIIESLISMHKLSASAAMLQVETYFTQDMCEDLIKSIVSKANTETKYVSKDITEEEMTLWEYLKIGIISAAGDVAWVTRVDANTQEYEFLTNDSKGAEKTYISFLHRTGLYTVLEKRYASLVNKGFTKFLVSEVLEITDEGSKNAKVTVVNYIPFDAYIRNSFNVISTKGFLFLKDTIRHITFDPTKPAYKYFNLSLLKPGQYPTWQTFLDKFESPRHAELYMEWMWSIFDESNTGSQMLVIRGPGNDGKGATEKVIANVLGTRATASVTDKTWNSEFAYSGIWNKRLVTWNDSKLIYPLSKGEIHSALSGDNVEVNSKNIKQFTVELKFKMMMFTNSPVSIKDEQNEKRRILFLQLKRPSDYELKKFCQVDDNGDLIVDESGDYIMIGDNGFKLGLEQEVYSFLYACKSIYDQRNTGTSVRIPSDIHKAMLNKLIDNSFDTDYFDDHFTINLDTKKTPEWLTQKRLREVFKEKSNIGDDIREKYYRFKSFEEALCNHFKITPMSTGRNRAVKYPNLLVV